MGFVYVGLGILAVLVIYAIAKYNGFIQKRNLVEEAFSTMDVFLKKRWDLIPNVVEAVKGAIKHEKETLSDLVKLRNITYDKLTTSEKIETNSKVSKEIGKLLAIAESYPQLRANENFMDLSQQLSAVENDIANARKYYNGTVRAFNTDVDMFPGNIFAKIFGFKRQTLFEIDEAEKENVKVQF